MEACPVFHTTGSQTVRRWGTQLCRPKQTLVRSRSGQHDTTECVLCFSHCVLGEKSCHTQFWRLNPSPVRHVVILPYGRRKTYHASERDLSTIRKKHFSAIEANWEFLGICGDFWSNISSSGPNRSMGLSFNHFSIRIKRALTANASNLQNTCLSSTLWEVGVSSSITSALPCSTTNRVPPWIQGKPSVRQRTD